MRLGRPDSATDLRLGVRGEGRGEEKMEGKEKEVDRVHGSDLTCLAQAAADLVAFQPTTYVIVFIFAAGSTWTAVRFIRKTCIPVCLEVVSCPG